MALQAPFDAARIQQLVGQFFLQFLRQVLASVAAGYAGPRYSRSRHPARLWSRWRHSCQKGVRSTSGVIRSFCSRPAVPPRIVLDR